MFLAASAIASCSAVVSMPAVFANSYPMSQKSIILDGKEVASPAGLTYQQTTYVPIWYIMHALSGLGFQSQWNGVDWYISTKSPVNLNHIVPGSGSLGIYVNGTLVHKVNGLVYNDPSSNKTTMYMPIWYVMQILNDLNFQSSWNGTSWNITSVNTHLPNSGSTSSVNPATNSSSNSTGSSNAVSPAAPASSAIAIPPSGVLSRAVSLSSGSVETWYPSNPAPSFQINALRYQTGSNQVPIAGTIGSNYTGDLLIQVLPLSNNDSDTVFWDYSIPVTNGHFTAEVLLPFKGPNQVSIGIPVLGQALSMNEFYASDFTNQQSSLSSLQMGLLQSWMANYNESPTVKPLAESITVNAASTDAKIEAVSNWVSSHIKYNWPAFNANQIPWQQTTQTLNTDLGVCQDEAAVAASLLRSIGIPTETIAGTLSLDGTTGAHEWDQSWNGQQWIVYDPTADQIYYQGTAASLPDHITDTYFNQATSLFDQTHLDSTPAYW
ncbi:transglutaminase-like domain-containing protein [Alicyclobacillus tolerans]|uniref:transglutaminase-like domain-containing protein n=1 Tax=Alicyclobacillus tolerans TaxID=90970 RepID=UPI001F303B4F|nr:transglutaminase-like domain-containing protein [Alicyclobacillus tolerans]MCF8563815.1 transglutaminase-like domain-containing protein [Alicyclobacillus tolerans]